MFRLWGPNPGGGTRVSADTGEGRGQDPSGEETW